MARKGPTTVVYQYIFKPVNSQKFFVKIVQIGPWVGRID